MTRRIKLGDFCSFLNGGTPTKAVPAYFDGDIPWITGADITGPIVTRARSHITEEAIKESATNRVPKGTILLVTRTSVGKVGIAGVDLCFSQDITAVLPDPEKADTGFLVHFLRTKQPHFEDNARGATIKGITRQVVADLELPLPPLEEQKRIAALLDKADALRRKRQEALRLTDDFLRSTFLDLFGDPAANPKGWPVVKASKLFADKPRLGTTRPATGKGYLVVRVGEIGTESVNFVKCGRVEQTPEELERFLLNKGDILIARAIGSRDQLGKCSYFDGHEELVVNDSHVMRLRPDPASCNPYWFYFLLSSPAGRQLVQGKGGATAVQFNINAAQISDLDVPLPPVTLQNQFLSLATRVRQTKFKQEKSTTETETLFSALQQRAFSGEL